MKEFDWTRSTASFDKEKIMKEVEEEYQRHINENNVPLDENLVSSPIFESINEPLQEVLSGSIDPSKAYDPSSSIYDNLSCEALDKFQSQEVDRFTRKKQLEEQRKLDEETFGPQTGPPINPNMAIGRFPQNPGNRPPGNRSFNPNQNQNRPGLPQRSGFNGPNNNNGAKMRPPNPNGPPQRPRPTSYPPTTNVGSGQRSNPNPNVGNGYRPNNNTGSGQRSNPNPNFGNGYRQNPNANVGSGQRQNPNANVGSGQRMNKGGQDKYIPKSTTIRNQ
jgi:hypothetical protein